MSITIDIIMIKFKFNIFNQQFECIPHKEIILTI